MKFRPYAAHKQSYEEVVIEDYEIDEKEETISMNIIRFNRLGKLNKLREELQDNEELGHSGSEIIDK